ncbi:MAG: PAS domain S-box protein [Sodalinema sp.]|uniref:PAS domain-containing hybrid sensor histidine kinase/response regulator n=1 Tax=Sodalinema sp. TaxID=3080550 RepID=UPI001204748E|nr:MAG: PAS domain S-box protein [Phormidium sp. SL48-SHIP]
MSLERENHELRRRVAELERALHDRQSSDADLGGVADSLAGSRFPNVLDNEDNRDDDHFDLDSQLFRAYLEAANDMVYAVDLQGRLTFMNSYGERLLGCAPQGWNGKCYLDFIAPDSRQATAEAFNTLLQTGELKDFEFQVQTANGTRRDLEVNGRLLYRQGVLVGGLGIARDITERKQFDRQLQMFMKAVDSAYDSTIIATADGTIVYANTASARMFGYEQNSLIGEKNRLFYPEYAPVSMEWLVEQALSNEQLGWSGEVTCQRATGESFPALISVGLIMRGERNLSERMEDDRLAPIDTISLIFRDITEQKRSQSELAIKNLELERASRLKSVFLANMSHELRTPLTSILGFSNLLLQKLFGDLNKKQGVYVKRIHESGQHLLRLISDILDLSKVEAGKIELSLTSISSLKVCNEAIALMSEQARIKDIQIHLQSTHSQVRVLADELRLRQMLLNLLSNAIKFSESGTRVNLVVTDDETYVYLTVRDEGIGIPEQQQSLLFQPFQQLDSSLARNHEGTGLGLALTRKLAELHGGTVTCRSSPGQGSEFTIVLPRDAGEPATANSEAAWGTALAPSDPVVASSLLLVEDHHHNALLLKDILEFWGYQVHCVNDGYEALAWLDDHCPDGILLDINLPELDGLTLTREIRNRSDLPRIPIIAITALAMPGDRQRCLDAGCDDYLTKPVSCDRLAELLNQHLAPPSDQLIR